MHALRNHYMCFKICGDSTRAENVAERFVNYQQNPDQAVVRFLQKIAYADLAYLIQRVNSSQSTDFRTSLEIYEEIEDDKMFSVKLQTADRMDCLSKHSRLLVRAVNHSTYDYETRRGYAMKAVEIMIKMWQATDGNDFVRGKAWVDLADLQTTQQLTTVDLAHITDFFQEETGEHNLAISKCEEKAMHILDGYSKIHARRTFGKIYLHLAKAERGSYEEWKRLLNKAENSYSQSLTETSWHSTTASGLATISIMRCGDLHYTKDKKNQEDRYRKYHPKYKGSEIGKHGFNYNFTSSKPDDNFIFYHFNR